MKFSVELFVFITVAENQVPFTTKHSLDQQSEKPVSDYSGADLKENLKLNLSYGSKPDSKMCTSLSSHQDVTVTEPALSKVLTQMWAKKNSAANLPWKNYFVLL